MSVPAPSQDARPAAERDLTVKDIVGRTKISEFLKFGGSCLAILVGVYSIGASQPFLHSTASVPEESKTYYGYYADFKPDGSPTISDETLSFERLPNSEVKATSTAEVKTKHGNIPKRWNYTGFQKGSRLSLTFSTVSTKQDPLAAGIGATILEQEGDTDYTGTTIYFDCDRAQMIECPYALTTRSDTGDPKGRWPKLFQRTCNVVNLVPDRARSLVSANSCEVGSSN